MVHIALPQNRTLGLPLTPTMITETLSHYRVLEEIGTGGMGIVYRAHDETLDRDVALKVLPLGMLGDEPARRRFRREACALAKLNHPNVGAIYEFGGEEGVDFLAMELVDGASLDDRLADGPLPEEEVLRLGAQLADALGASHAQGIIHRDLKPGNLRLTPDGRLKVLDFGLAEWRQAEAHEAQTVTALEMQDFAGDLCPTWRPSSCADMPPTFALTCIRRAPSCTKWQRGGVRSRRLRGHS